MAITKIEKVEEENVKISKTVHRDYGLATHVIMEIKQTQDTSTDKTIHLCLNGELYKCIDSEDIELPYMAVEVMEKTYYSWKDHNKKIFKPYQYIVKKYIWKDAKNNILYSEYK